MTVDHDEGPLSERLLSYLRTELANPSIELAFPLRRLQGGYETATYRFALDGLSGEMAQPLVLRLYPEFYGPWNARWESTIQNVLADQGYPVARVHLVCIDLSILGGAFFIMDHLPGQLLAIAPPARVPVALGEAQAALHALDPAPLMAALEAEGVEPDRYRLAGRYDHLRRAGDRMPWVRESVDWLLAHRPPEPRRLVVCHGDFHPMNILCVDGEITGVLDWPGFVIADPALDVANSLVLMTIPAKHLIPAPSGSPSLDWAGIADPYLAAYQARRPLDTSNLPYYRVRRCVMALIEGVEGQKVWQHRGIVTDLIAYVRKVSGITVMIPNRSGAAAQGGPSSGAVAAAE